MRGPPGSGKSTYANKHFPDAAIVSSDNFFMVDGEYRFNPAKLSEAHNWAMEQVIRFLANAKPTVVVDNTNIHIWEYRKYVCLANLAGYDLEVIQFRPLSIDDIRLCIERNTHGVPADVVARMCYEFEDDEEAEDIRIQHHA